MYLNKLIATFIVNYDTGGYDEYTTTAPEYYPTLSCYHCDAPNFEECYKIGKKKACPYAKGRDMVS